MLSEGAAWPFAASSVIARGRTEYGTEAGRVRQTGSEISGLLQENWLKPQPLMRA